MARRERIDYGHIVAPSGRADKVASLRLGLLEEVLAQDTSGACGIAEIQSARGATQLTERIKEQFSRP